MRVWVEVAVSGRIAVPARDVEEADRGIQEAMHQVHRRWPKVQVGGLEIEFDEALASVPGDLPSEAAGGVWERSVTLFGRAVVEAPSIDQGARRVEEVLAGLPGGSLAVGGLPVAVEAAGASEAREY